MAKFIVNKAIVKDIENEKSLVELLFELAKEVEEEARNLAPERTGKLKSRIDSVVGKDRGMLLARVNSNDYKSHWHEFGTKKMNAHPFLRPALERIGLKVSR